LNNLRLKRINSCFRHVRPIITAGYQDEQQSGTRERYRFHRASGTRTCCDVVDSAGESWCLSWFFLLDAGSLDEGSNLPYYGVTVRHNDVVFVNRLPWSDARIHSSCSAHRDERVVIMVEMTMDGVTRIGMSSGNPAAVFVGVNIARQSDGVLAERTFERTA
jgi:hypothetical protein